MTLKDMRKATGMTQAQFAEYTGVAFGTLVGWESGKRTTAPQYVLDLLEYKLRHEGLLKN